MEDLRHPEHTVVNTLLLLQVCGKVMQNHHLQSAL